MKFFLKFSLIPLLLHALTSQATLTVTNVAAGTGGNHSLFIKTNGSLWAMGYNANGQLGDGTLHQTNRPEQIVPSDFRILLLELIHMNRLLFGDNLKWLPAD